MYEQWKFYDFPDKYEKKLMEFLKKNKCLTGNDICEITNVDMERDLNREYDTITSTNGGNSYTVLDSDGIVIATQGE